MKPTKLTKEHKTKLLEMCMTLFPEYKWGFGDFYSSEVGAQYNGLDYLDVTHINNKIPCIKSRYELEHEEIDVTNLKVVKKGPYTTFDKVEYGFLDNLDPIQCGFSIVDGKIRQHDSYEEVYVEGIHWFEFCATILANKIAEVKYKPADLFDRMQVAQEAVRSAILNMNGVKTEHIVDNLYNQFKTMKL